MPRPGRGGDRRSGQEFGENSIRYFPICLWCGVEFGAKRPDTKTHCTACRVALNRYVKKHGQPPMFPFGLKPDEKPVPEKGAS